MLTWLVGRPARTTPYILRTILSVIVSGAVIAAEAIVLASPAIPGRLATLSLGVVPSILVLILAGAASIAAGWILRDLGFRLHKGYQTLLKEFIVERLYEEEKREGLVG